MNVMYFNKDEQLSSAM